VIAIAEMNRARAREWAPVGLAFACLALLPFGRLVEIPVIAMALCGAWLLLTRRVGLLRDPALRLFALVFLLAWVPMLLSLPDALNPAKTLEVVINHLRFLLGGIFLVLALRGATAHARLLRLCAWLMMLWLADAVYQYVVGVDVFGYEAWPGRLGAMFGPGNSKFGLTLATLSPLLWEYLRRNAPRWLLAAVVATTLAVIVLGGARSAWVLAAAIVATYATLAWIRAGRVPPRVLGAAALAVLIVCAGAYHFSSTVSRGVDDAFAGLTGRAETTSNSVSHRLVIWRAAWRSIQDNPLNGVGARGFRYGYTTYTEADDPFLRMDPPEVATHTHQLLIEVMAETGVIGLAGLLAYVCLLARAGARSPRDAQHRMLPYAIALAGAYFPLNSHLALYSAYWSQILWWLIALYCAAAARSPCPPAPAASGGSQSL
jgi:O-antigen ligase